MLTLQWCLNSQWGLSRETWLYAGADVIIIIIMDISKAPTLWLKAMGKHTRTHIAHIETETVINLTNS